MKNEYAKIKMLRRKKKEGEYYEKQKNMQNFSNCIDYVRDTNDICCKW